MCNLAADIRAQCVSGGDQDSLLFRGDAGVERDRAGLDARHPVRSQDGFTCNAISFALTRLGIDQTIVSMHVRRRTHVEMPAHHLAIEVLFESLLQRRKKIPGGGGRLRIAGRGTRCGSVPFAGLRVGQCAAAAAEQYCKDRCKGLRIERNLRREAQVFSQSSCCLFHPQVDSSRSRAIAHYM